MVIMALRGMVTAMVKMVIMALRDMVTAIMRSKIVTDPEERSSRLPPKDLASS